MDNTFYNYSKNNKKALIFVPHQDDEINICGGIIPVLKKQNMTTKIIYYTNGDYNTNPKTRIKESTKAIKKLELSKEDTILMGYSDQYSKKDDHIYMTPNNKSWMSKNGYTETYHPFNEKEVAMIYENKHHEFNKENFIKDLIHIIENEMPDYIFAIDFDSHADHRALSLGLEEAIGIILNKQKNYNPIVYKSFAYPTCYFGYNDFDNINIIGTKFKTEPYSYSKLENPYYTFEQRIRFPLLKKSITKTLLFNKTFKALKCHKSQCIVGRAAQTINGDQIFWQRRTDNLLYDSYIEVSSGDKNKLHDFMLFGCNNILKGNTKKVDLKSNAWIPDKKDLNPTIKIEFNKNKKLDEIVFYQSIEPESLISKVKICADGGFNQIIELTKQSDNKNTIKLDEIVTQNLSINIIERIGENSGFSEIEIFEKKEANIQFIKLEINGDFAYNYYYNNESFKVYSYDGYNSRYLNKEEYKIISNSIESKNDKLILKKKKNIVRIELKNNSKIYDEAIIVKKSIMNIIVNNITNLINNTYIYTCYTKQKVIRKIKRLLKIN